MTAKLDGEDPETFQQLVWNELRARASRAMTAFVQSVGTEECYAIGARLTTLQQAEDLHDS
jgi:hypothetical protein